MTIEEALERKAQIEKAASDQQERAKLYRTAKATIACAHFAKDEIVGVQFSGIHGGKYWFDIHETQRGKLENVVSYPETHLTGFCF